MKNWSNDPRYNYSNDIQFKSMKKILNFENVSFLEDDKFHAYFNLFEKD